MPRRFFIFITFLGVMGFFAVLTHAADIFVESFSDISISNDFLLEPAKFEVFLDPGKSTVEYLYVTNRLGRTMSFSISQEDFTGADDGNTGAILTGKTKIPALVTTPAQSFSLVHGERAKIPVTIAIPKNQKPGELFVAVVISAGSISEEKKSGTHTVGRAGALFFVRINGEASPKGQLKRFRFHNKAFELLFQNDGDIHLNPYGVIEIRNMFNTTVATIPIDPWFVMPGFSRLREIVLSHTRWGGRYTATVLMNRGYANQIDTDTLSFWIMPRVIVFAGVIIVGSGILFIIRKILLR